VEEAAMIRMIALMVIGCLLGVAVVAGNLLPSRKVNAQPPKAKQKWEYAELYFEAPIPPERSSLAIWTTGKRTIRRDRAEKGQPEPISMLNKDLGGKEESASFVLLFDRFGQDGWELVSHTRGEGPKRIIQTWTFKRAAQ
jgi:hypothetical protein